MYLRNGMMWQQRATAEGIPLKGNSLTPRGSGGRFVMVGAT